MVDDKNSKVEQVRTQCPYCGVGCSILLQVENNKVIGVKSNPNDPISEGKPCIKGLSSWEAIYAEDRYKNPMIRKDGKLIEVSWQEAYEHIYQNMKNLKPDEVMFYGSSPSSNEDNYMLQKFAREVFNSNSIDSCARLCHAATCYAFSLNYGIGCMPARIDDFKTADCIIIVGSNPKATYPVAFNKIMESKRNGGKLIVISVWQEDTADFADKYIQIDGGTETFLFTKLLRDLVDSGQVVISSEDKKRLIEISDFDIQEKCKISKEDYNYLFSEVSKSKNLAIGFGMGLTQHANGVDNIIALDNFAIAKKAKPISMRGKANIQGVGDMGCAPTGDGKTMTTATFFDPVKCYYIMESNPVQSMPYLSKVHEEFKKAFVVLHTTYPNSCAEEFADVVLPCCGWSEREGTYTNAESRVRWLNKAINPLFNTKPNYLIYAELAERFGFKFPNNIEDIISEIKLKRPNYQEIDINKIKSEEGQFVTKGPKYEKIILREPLIEDIQPSEEYPYLITTARSPYQFVTGEYSSRSKTINNLAPEALCLINPEDAESNDINDGQVFKIKSEVGEITIKAKITNKVPLGILVAPFHFEKTLFNKLVPLNFNKEVGEPNLKRIPVAIFSLNS